MNIFKKSRVKLQELVEDTYSYVREVYRNSNKVFSKASPFGQILNVLQIFTNKILFYIEHSIQELNIETASGTQSIYGIAKITGHQPTFATASTGILSIELVRKPDDIDVHRLDIPNFTSVILNESGMSYICLFNSDYLRIDLNKVNSEKEYFRVFQGVINHQTFTGTGEEHQTYEVNLKEGDLPAMNMINVYVNGKRLILRDSLYDITYGEESCIVKSGINSGISIQFGSESRGFVPVLGSEIYVEYVLTDGPNGNVLKSNKLSWQFESYGYNNKGEEINLNDYLKIKMITDIDNGTLPENTEITKRLIPHTSRSLVLAQTTNYEVFFTQMNLFSMVKVWTHYDKYNPYVDNIIYCMLIPDIRRRMYDYQSYFDIPTEKFLLTNKEKYEITQKIEESGQKVWGTYIHFVKPKINNNAINIYVNIKKGVNKNQLEQKIIETVSEYLLTTPRVDYIPKSEIIAKIEELEEVDAVHLDFVNQAVENLFNIIFKKELWKLRNPDDKRYIDIEVDNEEFDELYRIVNGEPDFEIDEEDRNKIIHMDNSNKQEIYNDLLNIKCIRDYINKYFDKFGNIKFDRKVISVFKGGFNDRYDNYYNDKIIKNKLSPINIFFNNIKDIDINIRNNNNLMI